MKKLQNRDDQHDSLFIDKPDQAGLDRMIGRPVSDILQPDQFIHTLVIG
ncbi:hypothetical protein [Mucilaginibacter achroorhodeus]|nr:hypothetical protein [Mucilaginibacter achroorhodeus]